MSNPVVRSYRDLTIWQEAMGLAGDCYRLTGAFPKAENYGMTAQIRRADTSIPANVAEDNRRENTGSYIQFLRISQGSLKELETHLLLSVDDGLATSETVEPDSGHHPAQ